MTDGVLVPPGCYLKEDRDCRGRVTKVSFVDRLTGEPDITMTISDEPRVYLGGSLDGGMLRRVTACLRSDMVVQK